MKILNSKKKDYFHYLQGVLGMDDKVVLDYEGYNFFYGNNGDYVLQFWICGWLIEGLFINDGVKYGENLGKYAEQDSDNKFFRKEGYYYIKDANDRFRRFHVLKKPTYFEENPNDFYNCPIMLSYKDYRNNQKHWKDFTYYKFPILKEFDFHKVWDEYKIWNVLYDWLSKDKEFIDNRTDKEKILSNGFHLKDSFRNVK